MVEVGVHLGISGVGNNDTWSPCLVHKDATLRRHAVSKTAPAGTAFAAEMRLLPDHRTSAFWCWEHFFLYLNTKQTNDEF